jgi:hypothetical protein
MSWRESLGNFDMGRLSIVGWCVFLLSVALAFCAALVFGNFWDSWFPPQPGNNPRRSRLPYIAGLSIGLGFFFASKWFLNLAGVRMVSPKVDHSAQSDEPVLNDLRSRVSRAKRWRLIFLLMMPLGCLLPCGLGLGVSFALGDTEESKTVVQILLLTAVLLPFVGLAGWWLMRSDVKKHSAALAASEASRPQYD